MSGLMACRCSRLTAAVAKRALLASRAAALGARQQAPALLVLQRNRRLAVRPAVVAAAAVTEAESAANLSAASGAEVALRAPAFTAHLDFKFIRDNVDLLSRNSEIRNSSADVAAVAALYDKYLEKKSETDDVRAARNANGKAMKQKLDAEARAGVVEEGKALKEQLAVLEEELMALEVALQTEGQRIPNLTHPDVPVGDDEELATVVNEVGEQRDFGFEVKDHTTLGEALGILDFDSGGVVSGSKFYYLKGAAALLELALVNWTMSKIVAKGFDPMITPDLIRESVLEKCGFQPRMENTQTYSVTDSDLCLTGTAEIPLGGLYMDQIIPEEQLPIRMAAFGRCFRTEAGAAGAAGKGLYRVHQFSKVEMFIISTAEQSEELHQELLAIETELFSELGLHFKVLDMPSCDLGAPAYRKFDVEAWMPGLGRYGEISSASNCTDYQSRRLNIRYRPTPPSQDVTGAEPQGGKKKKAKIPTRFVHTLNGTACAVPRMILAIMENNQQKDGTIVVPEVLRPYMGGIDVIRPKKA
mmetsp:Transcript_9491/g.24180  ORF Transcript_9491/g.24180 Transcript_9491/m.24180 type:complete len:530 (-) Transcript_9491:35-1624(-)|eukprot:jgi/Tetstr1/423556/TSEL_014229.t1